MIRTAPAGADGTTLLVTLDRPERRNALDVTALRDLAAALVDRPASVRAVVVTGAPPAFCAGADLTGVDGPAYTDVLNTTMRVLATLDVPTIAAVDGPALGAGTQVASACDLRVATASSVFGVPAARLGLAVDEWTVRRLVATLGASTARSLLVAAGTLDGARAHDLGFVHRLGGLAEAVAWADELAVLAPLTMRAHKRMLDAVVGDPPDDPGLVAAFREVWGSQDAVEGPRAFRDKRTPRFEGR